MSVDPALPPQGAPAHPSTGHEAPQHDDSDTASDHRASDHEAPSDLHAQQVAETFKLLADPTRVKLLWVLHHGERNVGDLAQLVGTTPTVVSQHLAKLRLAGLVSTRREATYAYYSATSDHVHDLVSEALSLAEHTTGTGPTEGHRYKH